MKVYLDILERVTWTAIQAAAAEWLVTQGFDMQTLKLAGAAAVVAAVKCVVATRVGDSDSAAALPGVDGGERDHPADPEFAAPQPLTAPLPARKKAARPAKKAAKKQR